jgi:tetratricopeptide (TPR) repeat protein/TolB-like protein
MKHKRFFKSLLLLAFICSVLSLGCNTPPDKKYFKDGKQHGVVKGLFRERWWNFYQRGCSFLEGGFYAEAIADFKEALKQRERDQRRTRTYGMHFIEYFPHRELGASYYHAGNYQEAEQELEASLSAVDSGRAKYYLNEVRRAILKTSKAATTPPHISVTSGADIAITNRSTVTVAGVVEGDAYARTITINNDPLFIELAQKQLAFSQEIKLKRGVNAITIKSCDLLGKAAEKTVAVTADFEGPLLYINNAVNGEEIAESSFTLQGSLSDSSGLSALKINEHIISYHREKNAAFVHPLQLAPGINRITLQATDVAGNTTTGELNIIYTAGHAQKKSVRTHAAADRHTENTPLRFALKGDSVLDTGAHPLFAAAVREPPAPAVRITLRELADSQTVFYDTIYIDGSATSSDEITSVEINGASLSVKPGRTIFFNQLIELKPGENNLSVRAQDKKGSLAEKTVTITYQIPAVRQIGSRMSLAILPFEQTGAGTSVSSIVNENLVSTFLHQERFNIVSRGPEFEAVLRELKLSSTELADKRTALRAGRLVAAEGILMGTIHETDNSIEIYARLINAETGAVMEAQDVYTEDKTLAQIQYVINGLSLKFKHSFPLIEGIVIKASGKDIYTDMGMASRIKKDMKFIIFRQGAAISHPLTGKTLGSEIRELGQARVVNVLEAMSIGRLIAEATREQRVRVKDRIITK